MSEGLSSLCLRSLRALIGERLCEMKRRALDLSTLLGERRDEAWRLALMEGFTEGGAEA